MEQNLKKKYFPITIKPFLSERCTSTASKTETVTHNSIFFENGMLRKFCILFKNVPYMTVTVEGTQELFFGFWTNQYIFVPNLNPILYSCNKKFLRNQIASLEMITEYVTVLLFLPSRETKRNRGRKTFEKTNIEITS